MMYDSNPPHPLNKKEKNIEDRVLKGKLFRNSVQQSNSPTHINFLKYNSLLYSYIYSFLNYIYIQHAVVLLDAVGLTVGCIFNTCPTKKNLNPTKTPFVGHVGRHPTLFLVHQICTTK